MNMNPRRPAVLALMLLLIFVVQAQPATTTLEEAVARAWAKSYGLKDKLLDEEGAKAERDFAARQKLFHLDFAGAYRYATDHVVVTAANFPFTSLLHIPSDQVLLSAPKGTYDLKLNLAQPLWTGGSLTNTLRADEERQVAASSQTQAAKVEIAGRVKTSYYTYRLLLARKRSLEILLENLGLHESRVAAFVREDLARRSDLLETRAKAEETRLSIEDTSQQATKERIGFATLTGLSPDDIEAPPPATVLDYAGSLAEFETRHPLLKGLEAQAAALDLSRKAVTGQRLPQLALFGEAHYARPGVNFFLDQWKLYGIAGLSLTVPVFNLNRIARDKAVIDVERRKLDDQKADILEQARKTLQQLYESLRSLEQQAASADRLIGLAEEDAGLKERLYRESQISNLDYLAALTDLERYRALKDQIALQTELVKVAVNTAIGRIGDQP
jgi:outer membrane protein TolC